MTAQRHDWSLETTPTLIAEIERLQATVDLHKRQTAEQPKPVPLKTRQEAGAEVERKMCNFLMQYMPARDLKIVDVHQIAACARIYAFDALSSLKE